MEQTQIIKRRRVTKEGCFYQGLHILGSLLQGIGALTLLGGLVGFIYNLFRLFPDFMDVLNHLDSRIGLMVFTGLLVFFGLFLALAFAGFVLLIAGLLAGHFSTRPAQTPIDKPLPSA